MNLYLFKLNGWPDTYDERIRAIAQTTDIVFIRSAPVDDTDDFADLSNVSVYDMYPRRGSYVTPSWARPIVFSLHVWQAIFLALIIPIFREQHPNVVHGLDYVLGGFAAMVVSTAYRCPLVLSVRGYKEPTYRSFMQREQTLRAKTNYWILVTLSKLILSRADHIITKAAYQRQAVIESTNVDPGFTTIPTGVDFERFDPSKGDTDYLERLFTSHDFLGSSFRLLYFGQIIPQKGVDKILRHLTSSEVDLPDEFSVVIIGDVRDEAYLGQIKQLADDAPFNVFIHSKKIPFEDVPHLLCSVDCVALLSEPGHEGVPRVLQESVAMEVPFVASDVTGITDAFVDLPGCYLVDREDPEAFTNAVLDVANSPPEMDRGTFQSKFDMYENYRKYGEVYRNCVIEQRRQTKTK